MKNISDLLKRFSTITPPQDAIRSEAARVIQKETGIAVEKTHISVRGNVCFVAGSPIQKNEIFLKKEKILSQLNAVFPDVNLTQIK